MFTELDWWGYLVIAALPLVGFALGYRWARQNPPANLLSPPDPDPRFLDAVDAVQRQLEELAERQEFTERLLSRRPDQAPPPPLTPRVPTPV